MENKEPTWEYNRTTSSYYLDGKISLGCSTRWGGVSAVYMTGKWTVHEYVSYEEKGALETVKVKIRKHKPTENGMQFRNINGLPKKLLENKDKFYEIPGLPEKEKRLVSIVLAAIEEPIVF